MSTTTRPLATIATTIAAAIAIVAVAGACSSDDEHGPPATGPAASIVPQVTESIAGIPSDSTVPSTGIGSINGPASVDTSFTGANPDGDEGGG